MLKIKFLATLATIFLFCLYASSCGDKKSSSIPTTKPTEIAATATPTPTPGSYSLSGSIADWPTAVSSFAGYQMLLFDIDSNTVLRYPISNSSGFSFTGLNSLRRFCGILLDNEFRFGWILQLASGSHSYSQVFQVAGNGTLGSLNIEGGTLRSSEESGVFIHTVSSITFTDFNKNNIPDGLEISAATYDKAVNSSGDLDEDGVQDILDFDINNNGVPNIFDRDVDNDGIPNLFDDDNTQNGISDAIETHDANPVTNIPEIGYAQVFHEIKKNDDDSESVSLWFVIGSAPGKFKQVSVTSGSFLKDAKYSDGSDFSGTLFDDGTHGDGVARDGLWSTPILLATGKRPLADQVVLFSTVDNNGDTKEYAQIIGNILSGNVLLTATVDNNAQAVNFSWESSGELSTHSEILYQILVFDDEDKRVYTSSRIESSIKTLSLPFSQLVNRGNYSAEIRVVTKSTRNGFPGSTWRSKKHAFSY